MTGHHVDHRARAENVRWLADTGESLTGAARRLGMTPDGIEKWARLRGELDVYARLRARDPDDPYRSEKARAGGRARWAS